MFTFSTFDQDSGHTSNVSSTNNRTQIVYDTQPSPNITQTALNLNNLSEDFNRLFNLFQSKLNEFSSQFDQKLESKLSSINDTMSEKIDLKFNSMGKLFVNNDSTNTYIQKVKNLTRDRIRYELHSQLLLNYIEQNKTPPSLLHNRFPQPMFKDDSDFLSNYNKRIEDFQKILMKDTIQELNKRKASCEAELRTLKELLSYVIDDINQFMNDIDKAAREKLNEMATKQNEVFTRINPKPFEMIKNTRVGHTSNFFVDQKLLIEKEESKTEGSGILPEKTVSNDNNRSNTHNPTSQNVAPSHPIKIQRNRNKNNNAKFIKNNLRNKMVYKPQRQQFQTNLNIPRKNKNKIMSQQSQNSQNTSVFNNNSILTTNRQAIKNRVGYGPVQNRIFTNSNRSNFVYSNKPALINSNRGSKQQQHHQHRINQHNNHQIRQPQQQIQQQNFRWQPRSQTRI